MSEVTTVAEGLAPIGTASLVILAVGVTYRVALFVLTIVSETVFPLFRGILTRRAPGSSAIQEHKNT